MRVFHIADDVIVRKKRKKGESDHEQPENIVIHFIFEA